MLFCVKGIYAWIGVIVLLPCLVGAWAHRFAPADGAVRVGMDNLVLLGDVPVGFRRGSGVMRISAGDGLPVGFAIPGVGGASHLWVRYHVAALGIESGAGRWANGRLFFEWMDGGEVVGVTPIDTARLDMDRGEQTVVVSSPRAGSVPVVRFQNLGSSGDFVMKDMVVVSARERRVWSWGKWFFAIGFLAVVAVLAGGTKKPARWRGWAAAGIWVAVAAGYAFPGPWELERGFVVPFVFEEVSGYQYSGDDGEVARMDVVQAGEPLMERLPPPADIGLRLKVGLPWLRPMMHMVMLFVPVLGMAYFVGVRRAFWLGWALSLSIEVAQTLYGFGFGWDDVFDLAVNGVGIFAALWVHRKFAARLHGLLPFRFPGPWVVGPPG